MITYKFKRGVKWYFYNFAMVFFLILQFKLRGNLVFDQI
jgi:hypothetical protein